ncbi:MAG TPA: N-acetylmuramoyl-L-alanine amidase, partial [Firmicutes bacterium]|nr:N-acetylmuramoyl-L-alanine amidase [Bacillota bacterium]
MPGCRHHRQRPMILVFIRHKNPAKLLALPLYAVHLIRRLDRAALVALAFIAMLVALLTQTAIHVLAPNTRVLIGKVIVVDPGHGGIDPGAHDREGTTEKEIVLDIARRLFGLLGKAKGIPIQTRHGDWSLDELYPHESTRHRQDLAARVHIANRINADAMVCIHVNKSPHASARGPVTFYNQASQDSRRLASCIQRRLSELQPRGAGGIVKGDFYILRNSKVPTVIAEVGFISNPEEKKLLLTPSYRQDIAEAILAGLADFFEGQGVSPAITN